MKVYSTYKNNREYVWYDSSNIFYSEIYDNGKETKNVKVVFKNGRTYVYKDVPNDVYIRFREGISTGKVFGETLKLYEYARVDDVEMNLINESKQKWSDFDNRLQKGMLDLSFGLKYNDKTGDFTLTVDGKPIYSGVEGEVSIINLLRALSVNYNMTEMSGEEYNALLNEKNEKL